MYYEERNPSKGLDGIFECEIQRTVGIRDVVHAHIHDHFELLYCTGGCFEIILENQTMILANGDLILIRPMQPHQIRTLHDGINQYTVMKFIPDGLFSSTQPIYELKYIFPFIYYNKQEINFFTCEQLKGSNIDLLLECLLEESLRKYYGYEMALRSYTEQVLLWFIRQWHHNRSSIPMDENCPETIKAMFLYINEHIDEPITVEQVARQFNMGRSTFSRFFNQYVGESLPSYIRRLRLIKAAKLLIHTNKSITEIATETGFSSISFFVKCFREQNGITPKHFRRNVKHI